MNETKSPYYYLGLKLTGYFSILGLVFFGLLTSIPLLFFGLPVPILPAILATVLAEILLIVAALAIVGDLRNWKEMLGLHRTSVKSIFIGAAFGVAAFILLQVISTIVINFFGVTDADSDTSAQVANAVGYQRYFMLLILVPFLVPFLEELVFRGYILTFLLKGHRVFGESLKNAKVMLAIGVSSLFFALVHLQGFSTFIDFFIPVWIFVVAIGNAILRIKFNSVYVSFASHAAYNLSTSLIILALH